MNPEARRMWAAQRPGRDHAVDATCVAPWVSIEFDPSGWVYTCCTSQMYPLGRIGRDRLRDLWGGERAQVLRSAMRRGDLSIACGPCRWHLEHGRPDPVAAVYDEYPVRVEEPDAPFMMLFALSNRCNLACVMCNGELSSRIRAASGRPALTSPYDDEFFDDLAPLLGDLKLAKFLGGEPFLAPEHRRVLHLMDQLDQPPRLQFTTNGTVWNDLVEWVLGRFVTDISISVDAATPETYARVRRGGDFAKLLANLERFEAACRVSGADLHVSFCLMEANWNELRPFLEWAERFTSTASVNVVTDTGLALHDLPTDRLREVRRHWIEQDSSSVPLDRNAQVWRTQLRQLDAVLDERSRGVVPAPRQAQRASSAALAVPVAAPTRRTGRSNRSLDRSVDEHVAILESWSQGGPIAVLRGVRPGTIREVPREHPRLGLTSDLVGSDLANVLATIERFDGRPAWQIESCRDGAALVRTFAMSQDRPVRGVGGSIVRTVLLERRQSWAMVVAEDRIYEPTDSDGRSQVIRSSRR